MKKKSKYGSLEIFLNEKNQLVNWFKQVSNRLQKDNCMVVIEVDKVQVENTLDDLTPPVNKVVIVMVGDQCYQRDIKIMPRDNVLRMIANTHRSHDALQYLIIF